MSALIVGDVFMRAVLRHKSVGGLVVKSIVAIDGPRVRFPADASFFVVFFFSFRIMWMNEAHHLLLSTAI